MNMRRSPRYLWVADLLIGRLGDDLAVSHDDTSVFVPALALSSDT